MAGLMGQHEMVSLMNRTEPSAMLTFTPPGWKLPAASMASHHQPASNRALFVRRALGAKLVSKFVWPQ